MGVASMDKLGAIMKQLNENLTSIGVTLRQMVMMQNQLINTTQTISTDISSLMEEMAEGLEQLVPEVVDNIGAEFLEQLKVSDPELYNKIPENIKKKYLESSEE